VTCLRATPRQTPANIAGRWCASVHAYDAMDGYHHSYILLLRHAPGVSLNATPPPGGVTRRWRLCLKASVGGGRALAGRAVASALTFMTSGTAINMALSCLMLLPL